MLLDDLLALIGTTVRGLGVRGRGAWVWLRFGSVLLRGRSCSFDSVFKLDVFAKLHIYLMLLYYVVMLCCIMYLLCSTLLGLFTSTSSFDIIGAMKFLSYFQLTSLSGPTARTGDSRSLFRLILLIIISCKSSYAGDLLEKN